MKCSNVPSTGTIVESITVYIEEGKAVPDGSVGELLKRFILLDCSVVCYQLVLQLQSLQRLHFSVSVSFCSTIISKLKDLHFPPRMLE